MKIKLSVTLATFNEEENLGRCLDSVKTIADEIIIVDGSSTDSTRTIAKKFGAKITKTSNKPIFHINKQQAVDQARGEWILALDADEEVSKNLATEIKKIIEMTEEEIRLRKVKASETDQKKWQLFERHQNLLAKRDGAFNQSAKETVAFFIPRVNVFLGHQMRHTGVYPDGVIRLFKKDKASFPAKSVHEQIQVEGRVDWLTHDLLHYDSPTFEKYLKRANRYTDLTAQELNSQQVSINLWNSLYYLIVKPKLIFLSLFVRHKGFLDGFAGFVFSLMSGIHWAVAYMKYWEIKKSGESE